jgi:DNA-damage-inducible protein J
MVLAMAKTEFIRARVDEHLKESVEHLFSRLGLSMTEAITLFLTQCEMRQGLPFEVRLPNEETRRALDDAHAGVNMTSYADADEMFKEMGI